MFVFRAPEEPTVILISLDGFRWDYRERVDTPNLDLLASEGVSAGALVPVFPTKTFPNHYSLVTGLHPDRHGVVANNMYDPDMKSKFSLGDRQAVGDGRWWGGEPVWVALGKRRMASATLFWPGSEAEIQGVRPSFWKKFDSSMSYDDRVDLAVAWLDLPKPDRPAFVAMYFSAVDSAGHDYGPDSPEVAAAVGSVDRALGRLLDGLRERKRLDSVNVIVVSDHGMANGDAARVIFLDDCINIGRANVIDWNPVAAMNPPPEDIERNLRELRDCSPHWSVYRKEDTPERLHYRDNPRIPSLIAIADEGWTVTNRSFFRRNQGKVSPGVHGYDNQVRSMWGIFLARGPAFRPGASVETLSSVDVYPMMMEILGLPPAPNDGDPESYRSLMTPPG